jgi:hypothetical protein
VQPSNRRGSGLEFPKPQYAFKMSMLNVSAIRIKLRSWLRSSSTHEPSDPPLGIISLTSLSREGQTLPGFDSLVF